MLFGRFREDSGPGQGIGRISVFRNRSRDWQRAAQAASPRSQRVGDAWGGPTFRLALRVPPGTTECCRGRARGGRAPRNPALQLHPAPGRGGGNRASVHRFNLETAIQRRFSRQDAETQRDGAAANLTPKVVAWRVSKSNSLCALAPWREFNCRFQDERTKNAPAANGRGVERTAFVQPVPPTTGAAGRTGRYRSPGPSRCCP